MTIPPTTRASNAPAMGIGQTISGHDQEMVTPAGVLGDHVYTRELMRGGTRARLLPAHVPAPRKPQAAYGTLVGPALLEESPGSTAIFSVGNSLASDGTAVMGFRAAGIPTAFFCCDPSLGGQHPDDLTREGDTLLTATWADLGPFVVQHRWVLEPTTLLVVDLDHTFWTPAGVIDRPATEVRDKAILDLLGRDIPGACLNRRRRCLDALSLLEDPEFQTICADDEERKALLAAAAAMTGFELTGDAPGLFPTLDRYAEFLRWSIATAGTTAPFFRATEALAWIVDEMMTRGTECLWAQLRGDVHSALARFHSGEATVFPAFRDAQREISIEAADPARPAAERFMANRAVVDLIRLATANGCRAVGLSDRPALAIFPEAGGGTRGRSLWTTPMGLAGPALFLPRTRGAS